jgi:hypothetical protein
MQRLNSPLFHPMKILLQLTVVLTAVVLILCFVNPNRTKRNDSESQPTEPARTKPSTIAEASASRDYNRVDADSASFSIATFKATLLGTNQSEMKIAFAQLANYLAQHPDKTSEFLEELKFEESYPQLFSWLSEWNAENPTPEGRDLIKNWASELVQTDHSAAGQQAALGLLNHATPELEFVPLISQLYRDAANNQLQVSAIVTLKDWAGKNPHLQSAIQDQLIEIVNASSDEEVRERAFEAVASVGLSDATLIEAANLLWQEPTDANRSLLAMAFEKAGNATREFALTRLEQVCNDASDLTAQKAALAQIVRLGKRTSTEILQRLNAAHPELEPDVKDYLQILQGGAADIATIDRKKLEAELQTAALSGQNVP